MDQAAAGLKQGFYHPITLERLRAARCSLYKPFPPKNTYLEFDFTGYHPPQDEDVRSALQQAAMAHLSPPIKNMGIRDIRHAAKELVKWPAVFDDRTLLMNLFNLYIFIEIGGTGGGCFRYMYARFLNEAAGVTGDKRFLGIAEMLHESGTLFSNVGNLFSTAKLPQTSTRGLAKPAKSSKTSPE